MIDFMLIAAPRSGTTWASNWLTTDTTLCIHDPLWEHHYSELDDIQSEKRVGIACTGMAYFLDWVNKHPARKVILHRDLEGINESLYNIGLPDIEPFYLENLDKVEGLHVWWTDLFENPKVIYEYLLQLPFDKERHKLLKDIEMQPKFSGLTINKAVTMKLLNELKGA
jgi:hypothetical protein